MNETTWGADFHFLATPATETGTTYLAFSGASSTSFISSCSYTRFHCFFRTNLSSQFIPKSLPTSERANQLSDRMDSRLGGWQKWELRAKLSSLEIPHTSLLKPRFPLVNNPTPRMTMEHEKMNSNGITTQQVWFSRKFFEWFQSRCMCCRVEKNLAIYEARFLMYIFH